MKVDTNASLAMVCATGLVLAACGGDSTTQTEVSTAGGETYNGLTVYGLGGSDGSDILAPALASARLYRSEINPQNSSARVATVQYDDQTSVKFLIDFYKDNLDNDDWDGCIVQSNSGGSGSGSGSDSTVPYVDAGPYVVINSPTGPWFTMNQGTDLLYDDTELPGALPVGATLSIPGAIFPAVEGYPLFEPAVPVRTAPLRTQSPESAPIYEVLITQNSEYSWIPDGDPGTYMVLEFYYFDGAGYDYADLYCVAEDDGSFVLPFNALAHIAAADSAVTVYYKRVMRRFDYIDGIAFFQRSSVGE